MSGLSQRQRFCRRISVPSPVTGIVTERSHAIVCMGHTLNLASEVRWLSQPPVQLLSNLKNLEQVAPVEVHTRTKPKELRDVLRVKASMYPAMCVVPGAVYRL